MKDIRIAAAQFEPANGDKKRNLDRMAALAEKAAATGARMVSFQEGAVTGYSFLRKADGERIRELAEPVPDGESTGKLVEMARRLNVAVLAGLLEAEGETVYNTYVCVTKDGLAARHRKLHAFINPHISSGDEYTVFDHQGCRCGILICYDNNLPENVRMTALRGAEILFMPHVTCCLPSDMPGRGTVAPALWENRERDPASLRREFLGPKGRGWLMRWLPARAYENGIYVVFTNPVGMDDDQVRNGNAMILDPYGEIIAESVALGDDVVTALCPAEKYERAPGRRYLKARRPELYAAMTDTSLAEGRTKPGWDTTA